jgi:lactate permease
LVDIIAAMVSMICLAAFLRIWHPANVMTDARVADAAPPATVIGAPPTTDSVAAVRRAWTPWLILALFVFLWGTPQVRASLDGLWAEKLPVLGLHDLVQKMPPVVSAPRPEPAIYNFNLLSATGTGIFLAAIISGIYLGYTLSGLAKMYGRTIYLVRYSLVTISCMMAVGFITKYAGTDATLGLALAGTGWAYPFFGTMIGWLGVALTGSDTSSNVLFGGLQRITAEQLNIDPVVMAAANSSGGVMGKMIDAQSIVVASTATKQYGQEGAILRFVFFHSVALAMLVGVFVMGQVYVWPLTLLAPPIR